MINVSKSQIIAVVLVCLLGLVYAAPNLLAVKDSEEVSGWLPHKQINLGLDLQGGLHLLFEVDVDAVLEERLTDIEEGLRAELRANRIRYEGLGATPEGVVRFAVRNPEDAGRAREIVDELAPNQLDVEEDGPRFQVGLTEQALRERRTNVLEQSIEIIRRRVDETGTREPTIQRQGEDRILLQLPGEDDPQKVKRILGQTAKLTFHLVDATAQPGDRVPPGAMRLPEDPRSGNEGFEWVVRKRVMVSGENLVDAQATFDNNGRPAVSIRFDTTGARRFGQATTENVGQLMAIVLDQKVLSAPRINEPIPGGNAIITGSFSVQEANELALLLRAGALPAPLLILEERTVGPGLGADSVAAGKVACAIGLGLVIVFMIASYGLFGLMSCIALLLNLTLIVAVLSVLQATLTLPGIAGIVLTMGMAVDANVLIFERIREEIRGGRTPISSIDAGYRRALTTIIDANLTTLIAAALLYSFGTGPIKGFAVTLSIGIVTSMFTAIMVTRLMVVGWLRRARPKAIPI